MMVESERARLVRMALQNERLLEDSRERQARFQQLLDISHELARAHVGDDVLLQRIAQRGAALLGADVAGVLLMDNGTLVVRGAFGDVAGVFGDAARSETRSRLADALRMSDAIMVPELGRARTGMVVPLRAAWQVIGVFAVARRAQRAFTVDDVLIASIFAAHAATAVANARLYHETREANRRKDDFLARLAHELRNPLAPLVNALQVLGRVAAGPDVTRLQAIMAHQAGHLGALVDDILDVSRLRFDKLMLNLKAVDLCEIARHSFEAVQLSPLAEGHDVTLSANGPIIVNADPIRLEQVIGNLLNNAVKYTPRGEPIRVSVEKATSDAIVTVRDHGIGIAADMLPHVFTLYTQVERSRHRAQGGLGLGLALVRALVERHGGTVSAQSAGLGEGSEFTVRLPLARAGDRLDDGFVAAFTRPRRVLIVQDDPDEVETLRNDLEKAGHSVAGAAGYPAAVEVAAFFRPEVALIDLGLPGIDGHDIARRVRHLPQCKRTHLVAFTGNSSPDDLRARATPFDVHLVKPVSPATVLALVAHLRLRGE
jgi:signal transduction histidine kinase/CheY-like chemotaxis protein